jgi:hypothetical protein
MGRVELAVEDAAGSWLQAAGCSGSHDNNCFYMQWFWGSSALYLQWSLCCGPAINMAAYVSHEGPES